ncbi:MAG TPA: PqqD family protein [Dissulfurispiraceae bacterium]
MPVGGGAVFRKNPDVVFRRIGDEAVLVPIVDNVGDLSCIYTLNETGARLWELFDSMRNVEEICGLIAGEFDVQTERAADDISGFVEELSAMKFLLSV